MSPFIIAAAAFVGVAALVGGVALMFRERSSASVEDRLSMLTGSGQRTAGAQKTAKPSVLNAPLDSLPGFGENLLGRFGDIDLLFEQADTSLTVSKLLLISAGLAGAGVIMGAVVGIHPGLLPVMGLVLGALPIAWLLLRRKKRLKAFAVQLPDALEMMSRALRAGQSLGAGFQLVAQEMPAPIGKEFGRVFEEQNLGVPPDEALDNLSNRVPNLDLKFFCTAVILQKQTGGDLAEILDKIGRLIRERFQIWGQIQALTGEGRLSGVVLMALPVFLFVAVYQLNPDYIMLLFQDPLGKKMLAGAIILQVLGALMIRKIVRIEV
jgi:tight adherence protein B